MIPAQQMGKGDSNPMYPWVAALPSVEAMTNGVYFDDECRRLLKGTAMEDSLDVLPLKSAFDKTIQPLMASKGDVWPESVSDLVID